MMQEAEHHNQLGEKAVAASPCALAILARYPRPGTVKTRLAAGIDNEAAAALYRAFLEDLASRFSSAAPREGYALFWAQTPEPGNLRDVVGTTARVLRQRGADLGERLYNLRADLAGAGYERVVMIGSDAPHLPAATVRTAFDILVWRDVALGPAKDGGYYLAGLRSRPEPPDIFRGIEMSTPLVLAQTLRRIARLRLTVGMLPPNFDVDEVDDLRRLRHTLTHLGAGAAPAPRTLAALLTYARRACDGAPGDASL